MKYLLGIDIGTQGTKTSLFDLNGNIIKEAFESSNLITRNGNEVEQNPDDIYNSVLNTVSEVVKCVNSSNIKGIGIDAQMAGIMGIDDDWNYVTPYDSWLDTRCAKYISIMKEHAEKDIIRITGCPVTYAHGPKILWWKYEKPLVYKKISKFVVLSAYITGRLTGLKAKDAYIDYTQLHFSGFGDVEKAEWSQKLIKTFDMDAQKLPKIVKPCDIVGYVTDQAASLCGLMAGTPVVAGCGDQPATSLAAGIVRRGMAFDGAGTASVFSCCTDNYNPDVSNKTILHARSVIDGLWIPLAYINGGGLCLKWLSRDITGISLKQLDEEADKVSPGSNGLIFLPHFTGRACPNDPNAKGGFIDLNFNHGAGHMHRAVMESIAFEYKMYAELLNSCPDRVTVIGGGAKSRVFNQIKADVLGVKYALVKSERSPTYGIAVVAGYGVSLYNDIAETIMMNIEIGNEISPCAGVDYSESIKKYRHYMEVVR